MKLATSRNAVQFDFPLRISSPGLRTWLTTKTLQDSRPSRLKVPTLLSMLAGFLFSSSLIHFAYLCIYLCLLVCPPEAHRCPLSILITTTLQKRIGAPSPSYLFELRFFRKEPPSPINVYLPLALVGKKSGSSTARWAPPTHSNFGARNSPSSAFRYTNNKTFTLKCKAARRLSHIDFIFEKRSRSYCCLPFTVFWRPMGRRVTRTLWTRSSLRFNREASSTGTPSASNRSSCEQLFKL